MNIACNFMLLFVLSAGILLPGAGTNRSEPVRVSGNRHWLEFHGRSILVGLTVQDGWPKTRFAHHPFNAALGNGPLTDRKQLIALGFACAGGEQAAYGLGLVS